MIRGLTSDPANEFFGQRRFFFAVVWTRLTNVLVERVKEDKECTSEEEDGNEKGRMPTDYWEEFQSLGTKLHPNKAEMNRLCALVEDQCLNHFKNILKKKRNSVNFGQIFHFSFSKETEASY